MKKFKSNDFGGLHNNIVIQIALILWGIVQLYPIFWLLMASFKPSAEVRSHIFELPKSFYLGNYDFNRFNEMGITIAIYVKNSIIVTTVSLTILMIISTLAAYGIAKLRVPGKNILIIIMLALTGVPIHALMIPIYYFFSSLGMINNLWGLILPYIAFNTPFATIVLQAYFRQFPNELLDAAKIDGCGNIKAFISVVMPISMGAISSVLVISFLSIWNEFLFSLVMMRDNASKTLPVGLMGFKGRFAVEWGPMMAGLVLAIIPTILIYIIFNRNLLKGISAGAIKG